MIGNGAVSDIQLFGYTLLAVSFVGACVAMSALALSLYRGWARGHDSREDG